MGYYIKTICTKAYFFVQQHCLVTVMINSVIHLNKGKKNIMRCFTVRWKWYINSHFYQFFPTSITQVLAEVSYLVVCIWSIQGCRICCLGQPWKYYQNTNGEKNSAGRVYFHWFCTSVFPNSSLMSSQMAMFNWMRDQIIKLLSI